METRTGTTLEPKPRTWLEAKWDANPPQPSRVVKHSSTHWEAIWNEGELHESHIHYDPTATMSWLELV